MNLIFGFPFVQKESVTLQAATQYLTDVPTDYLWEVEDSVSNELKYTWLPLEVHNPRYSIVNITLLSGVSKGFIELNEGIHHYRIYGMTSDAIALPISPFNLGVVNEGVVNVRRTTAQDWAYPVITETPNIIYNG